MLEFYGSAEEVRDRITSKLLLQAIDYWVSLSGDGSLPKRSQLDPMAHPKLLPTTFIVRAESDDRFRYQLAGSLIEEKYQVGSAKDKTPEELMGPAAQNVLKPYGRVRDEGILFYREGTLEWMSETRKYSHYKVLLMPLSDTGEKVNFILGVQDFIRATNL